MSSLSWVLLVKIVFTVFGLGLPMLFCPKSLFKSLGFDVPEPIMFLRLLGMAYIALVVTYWDGFETSLGGAYPAAVVWTGIGSNGGAFVILVYNAISGTWRSWGKWARAMMQIALVVIGGITAGLIIFGVLANAISG